MPRRMRHSADSLESFVDSQEQLRAGMGIASDPEDEPFGYGAQLPTLPSGHARSFERDFTPQLGARAPPRRRRSFDDRPDRMSQRAVDPYRPSRSFAARPFDPYRPIKTDSEASSVASDDGCASFGTIYDARADVSEDENCAVLLSRAAAQREAEHKHKVKEAWRAFEDRLLATFGEAHDRVPADAAALRDAEALVVELYGWSGALGKVGKKAQKHLQKLGRHRELGEALGLRGRNPVAHARLHELAPNERFNIAAAAGARVVGAAAGARDARDERRRTRSSADSLSDAETKQSAAALPPPAQQQPDYFAQQPPNTTVVPQGRRRSLSLRERPSHEQKPPLQPPAQGRRRSNSFRIEGM